MFARPQITLTEQIPRKQPKIKNKNNNNNLRASTWHNRRKYKTVTKIERRDDNRFSASNNIIVLVLVGRCVIANWRFLFCWCSRSSDQLFDTTTYLLTQAVVYVWRHFFNYFAWCLNSVKMRGLGQVEGSFFTIDTQRLRQLATSWMRKSIMVDGKLM